jgi:hypothetical protein
MSRQRRHDPKGELDLASWLVDRLSAALLRDAEPIVEVARRLGGPGAEDAPRAFLGGPVRAALTQVVHADDADQLVRVLIEQLPRNLTSESGSRRRSAAVLEELDVEEPGLGELGLGEPDLDEPPFEMAGEEDAEPIEMIDDDDDDVVFEDRFEDRVYGKARAAGQSRAPERAPEAAPSTLEEPAPDESFVRGASSAPLSTGAGKAAVLMLSADRSNAARLGLALGPDVEVHALADAFELFTLLEVVPAPCLVVLDMYRPLAEAATLGQFLAASQREDALMVLLWGADPLEGRVLEATRGWHPIEVDDHWPSLAAELLERLDAILD